MIMLNKGDTFILTNKDILGDETKVSVTYKNLYNEVQIGTKILINDGNIEKMKEYFYISIGKHKSWITGAGHI